MQTQSSQSRKFGSKWTPPAVGTDKLDVLHHRGGKWVAASGHLADMTNSVEEGCPYEIESEDGPVSNGLLHNRERVGAAKVNSCSRFVRLAKPPSHHESSIAAL